MRFISSAERVKIMLERDPYQVTREPFPAPIFTSRDDDQQPEILPAPVLKLAEFAREAGWEVRIRASQGCLPHSTTGRPGALKDLIGVRFGAHPMTDRQAYAIYAKAAKNGTWAWSSVMLWGPDLPAYGAGGLEHLNRFLFDPTMSTEELSALVDEVRDLRIEQEASRKARDAFRKEAQRVARGFVGVEAAQGWPGALLAAWEASERLIRAGRGMYDVEDIVKIIQKRKTNSKEGFQ